MTVQMPFAGLLLMHRLVRVSTPAQRHLCSRDIFAKLHKCRMEIRALSTASVKCNENEGDSSSPLTSRQGLLSRGRRPLSPLERISNLLPKEALSPEVMQLREQKQQEDEEDTSIQHTQEDIGPQKEDDHASDATKKTKSSDTQLNVLPGESLLVFGELLVAEYRKKGEVAFRKMFELKTKAILHSSWGVIEHNDIVGKPAGCFLNTHRRAPILIRRATLEDYVLLMKRGAAIAYPKDAATMLLMMDVTEGDCVLESGSGSGGLSLLLSRAVGCRGSVLSVEVRQDHHRRAVLNYNRWRSSWSLRRGEEWPDNVQFHHADLSTASSLLASQGFHSVALDMTCPQLVLPTVIPHLHPGAVCAVYVANLTQVVDLLEGLRCTSLPLLCERVIEVPVRDWLVTPALQKNGRYCVRNTPVQDKDQREKGETSDKSDKEMMTKDKHPAFGSIPYLGRPHHEQNSHTAFLVKLRKFVP
ncbi:tRNA (adenine(58)-N(1))-methyltransferase, mitochondrial [Plectropomus leopardus]|uniref:tRNA (adenine(58)-N(1))-methyltransferase, mitochondrial n=1 Tax=Plectropomus leopardus TaxID=160734 RepID=UPI001C4B29A9|nr:tRNA (adenine(58)-N(1))-methyltransferase, mitochondrial [Plectropomus leopardus]